jgi:hypothetical protein
MRMLSMVDALAMTSAAARSVRASRVTREVSSTPKAQRVASMLLAMYSLSLAISLGLTWYCWTMYGASLPANIQNTNMSTMAATGIFQPRKNKLTRKSAAATRDTMARTESTGSVACTSA